ncbi:hypothetical protein D3C72_930680 [compost metagenome]
MGVVDVLEMIHVQSDDGERRAGGHQFIQPLAHGAAVHQPGHRIGQGFHVQPAHLMTVPREPACQGLAQFVGFHVPGAQPAGLLVLGACRVCVGQGVRQAGKRAGDGVGQGADKHQGQQHGRDGE